MSDLHRYHRQMLLPGVGETGQRRLSEARVLLVGCGALGTMIADILARAGAGLLRIVDRDLVEITNLQRQVLFDERDVEEGIPKAQAARTRLERVNHEITVEAHVDDFNARNAEHLAEGVDIIMDGLDNFETRYLLNDLAVSRGLPYVYGGAVGTTGLALPILPHPRHRIAGAGGAVTWSEDQSTPCLRCVFPEAPPPGSSPTCDTAGVLGPVVAMVAAHQAAQALKLLTGNLDALDRHMLSLDLWSNQIRRFDLAQSASEQCPCCGAGIFEFLAGAAGSSATTLCGRNAVQVTPADGSRDAIDLGEMATRLAAHGVFTQNQFLLRGAFEQEQGEKGDQLELTLFANGRAIIKGTTLPEVARSVYARYVGA